MCVCACSETGKSFYNVVLQTFYQLSLVNVFVANKGGFVEVSRELVLEFTFSKG